MSEQQKVDEDIKAVEDMEGVQDMEGVEGDEGVQYMEEVEGDEGDQDMEGVEHAEGVEHVECVEDIERVENVEGNQENKEDAQCEEEKMVKTFNVYHTHRNIIKFICKLFPVIKGDLGYWAPEIAVHRIWALSGINITHLNDDRFISISDEDDFLTSESFCVLTQSAQRETIESFIKKHYKV